MEITNLQLQREIDFLKASADEIAALSCRRYPEYTESEVAAIIEREKDKVEADYKAFVKDFHRKNQYNHDTARRDYVLLFSFPGAGKPVSANMSASKCRFSTRKTVLIF